MERVLDKSLPQAPCTNTNRRNLLPNKLCNMSAKIIVESSESYWTQEYCLVEQVLALSLSSYGPIYEEPSNKTRSERRVKS